MAIFRNVNINFWSDVKVVDDYTPEDKYFMLYALTNVYTNIIGCYEISIKQMSIDLGYTKDMVESLIKRFEEKHKTILYDFETKELFITNWNKYNWSASPKLDPALFSSIEKVKSDKFHDMLADVYNIRETIKNDDTLYIRYRYTMDTTNSNSNRNRNSNSNSNSNSNRIYSRENLDIISSIVDYLNSVCGTNYKKTSEKTKKLIRARLNENYTLNDFKIVIDKKAKDWIGTEMEKYLRPETLFGTKFENYLNQKEKKENLPEWFNKEVEKKQDNLEELQDLLKEIENNNEK